MNECSYSKRTADKKSNDCCVDIVLRTNRHLCGTVITYSLCEEGGRERRKEKEREREGEGKRKREGESEGGRKRGREGGGREREKLVEEVVAVTCAYPCFHTTMISMLQING